MHQNKRRFRRSTYKPMNVINDDIMNIIDDDNSIIKSNKRSIRPDYCINEPKGFDLDSVFTNKKGFQSSDIKPFIKYIQPRVNKIKIKKIKCDRKNWKKMENEAKKAEIRYIMKLTKYEKKNNNKILNNIEYERTKFESNIFITGKTYTHKRKRKLYLNYM